MRAHAKFPLFLALGGLLALPACSKGETDKEQPVNKAAPHAAATPTHAAVANEAASGPGPQSLSTKTKNFEFSYKWPGEASAIPELNSWLKGNGEKIRADNEGEAQSEAAEAKKAGYDFTGHSYDEDYATVANTPRLLVLLSEGYVFTGGAHGMPINTAILWDKAAKKRLATATLIDIPRLATVAKKRFCDELDKQRAEKRGEPVRHDDPDQLDDFVKCVDMTKQLILPVTSDLKKSTALDMIRIVIGPYEAGPYVEGSYVIDMPVDAALLTTVKTGYRDYFAAPK
ncbi:MAG TPA: DUF4163 domain-containing protein [Sphingobium sp.]|uniref:DUF4163 domain-containing protein n=1 Tax=Sphingobium sp. TaxID=1912891 RepID=UPI002ED6AEB0